MIQIKLSKKQKECFQPHVMMHSLFGMGLGLIMAALFPTLPLLVLGILACVVAFVLDAKR